MIVMGYPCTGKSTWSSKAGSTTIDLESSYFGRDFKTYVNVALDLDRQGYVVFVSCHPEIRKLLIEAREKDKNLEVGYLYPDPSLKETWLRRAKCRYQREPTDKNQRALTRIQTYFDEDIQDIINSICDNKFTDLKIHKPIYRFGEIISFPLNEENSVRRRLRLYEIENTPDEESEQTYEAGD